MLMDAPPAPPAAVAIVTELAPRACAPQQYTPEALRYEMEGSVRLVFSLDADGKPVDPRVEQASGYALLDRDAIAHLNGCRFPAGAGAVTGIRHAMTVRWQLPQGRPEVAPALVPDSCARRYKALSPGVPATGGDVLTVRMQVWPDGRAFTPKIERSSGEPEIDRLAEALVEHCRYTPAMRNGRPVQGAMLLPVQVNRATFAEAQVRASYERIVTRIAQKPDVKIAHILYAEESAARAAIAAIRAGAAFGTLARRDSLDTASGQVDGELGWVRPDGMVEALALALQAQKQPGLIADPVPTKLGWHVLRVDSIRPATAPLYAAVKDRLRSMLIVEEATPTPSVHITPPVPGR